MFKIELANLYKSLIPRTQGRGDLGLQAQC